MIHSPRCRTLWGQRNNSIVFNLHCRCLFKQNWLLGNDFARRCSCHSNSRIEDGLKRRWQHPKQASKDDREESSYFRLIYTVMWITDWIPKNVERIGYFDWQRFFGENIDLSHQEALANLKNAAQKSTQIPSTGPLLQFVTESPPCKFRGDWPMNIVHPEDRIPAKARIIRTVTVIKLWKVRRARHTRYSEESWPICGIPFFQDTD